MKRFLAYLVLFLLTVTGVGGIRLYRLENSNVLHITESKDLYLHKSNNVDQLSTVLVDSLHWLADKKELKWAAQLLGWNSFKPGHYLLKEDITYDQLLEKLAKGVQDPISVTILPGRRQKVILSDLAKNFQFDSTAIYSTVNDTAFIKKYGLTPKTVVGHLYPETYQFYWTASPQKVLGDIFTKFSKAIQPFQDRLKTLDKSLNEILALASIVEWEAGIDSAKTKISGLYWNRLKRGMLLQADPTVLYALGEKRRLYLKDYKIKDPYNTYIHHGLPPGPITNPDLRSIKAALYPADHEYIYMVAQPNGGHAFSKTYAQHQRRAEKWRQWLQKQYKIKAKKDSG